MENIKYATQKDTQKQKYVRAAARMGDAGIVHGIIPRGQVIITFVHFFIRTKFVLPQVTEIDMNLT